MLKDAEEVAEIREAIRIAERAFTMFRAMLRPEDCEKDLVDALESPQATVSHHLRILCDANLVVSEKRGRENYYRLTLLAEARHAVF
jgi:DNA-binding transcriptional ArsR family regulator